MDALQMPSQAIMDLLSTLPEDIITLLSTMTEVSDDPWMQDYADEEDLLYICIRQRYLYIPNYLYK